MVSGELRRRPTAGRRGTIALVATLVILAGACGSGSDESTSSVDTAPTTVSDQDDDFIANSSESTPGTEPPSDSTPAVADTTGVRGQAAAAIPDPEFPVSIIEIDFLEGTLTIANHGAKEVDLGNVWICEFPDYEKLDAQMLPAGESVTITNPHGSAADDGELALYRTNDFGSADAILSYVEWGGTGHTRAPVAVEAGVWGTDAADAGQAIATGGVFAIDAADWSVLVTLTGIPQPAPSAPASSAPASSASTTAPASGSTPAPPPDDYSPSAPPPPPATPTTKPTTPPPDDYSASAAPPPPATPTTKPTTPPPDEY